MGYIAEHSRITIVYMMRLGQAEVLCVESVVYVDHISQFTYCDEARAGWRSSVEPVVFKGYSK
jgi:hypothetical protein